MQHIYISYNFLHYKSTSNIVFDIIFINIKTGTAILKKLYRSLAVFIKVGGTQTIPLSTFHIEISSTFQILFHLFPYGSVAICGFSLIYYHTPLTAKDILS